MNRIDSLQNPRVKQWKKLQTKKERDKTGTFIVEGFHLVEEALKANIVQQIIVSETTDLPSNWSVDNADVFVVTDTISKAISETETPQGVFAVCEKIERSVPLENGRFLLLDSIQDPGNLGAIIRTADAAGMDAVVIGKGCVDVYNSKVLRSTQGSVFHLPIVKGSLHEWIGKLQQHDIPVYGTALQNAVPYTKVKAPGTFALIVGNEGSGVRSDLLEQCDQNLYIPIYGQAESLNVSVATGILAYYLQSKVDN